MNNKQIFRKGMRDGIPIGLGYLAVSFSLGITARNIGLTPFQGFLVSLLNNASAGEYAGFTVMATDAAMKQGAHAGNLIKSIAGKVGGGGGGRPNMAQAGGKNPAGILEAIAEAKTALEAQLS